MAMDHEQLVRRAGGGDVKAFVELTRRFQQFAFGSALALVRDFQHAEDVVQDSFVAAWSALPTLAEPAAFPGWLRGIVRHHAFRLLRRKRLSSVPLEEAESLPDEAPLPDHILEQRRQANAALAVLSGLPDKLREPATLAFVHDCSHQDVATFLGLSLTTVNNRLHAARSHLKQRLAMVTDTLHANALPDEFAHRIGRLIETRGNVVDALFDPAALPDLMTELTVSDEARKGSVTVRVMQRPGGGIVRGLAASAPPQLPRGATVLSSRRRSAGPVDQMQLDRLVPLLAAATTDGKQTDEVVETGIKVIDVMCPIRAGGSVAIASENGAGGTVVMEEIVRRIGSSPHPVTMFMLIPPPSELWPPSLEENYSFSEDLRKEGYSEGTVGNLQTFFLTGIKGPWTPQTLAPLAPVDSLIVLARDMIVRKSYPGVDVRTTRARLLDDARLPADVVSLAREVRDAIAWRRAAMDNPDAETPDPVRMERARKLQSFFSQPFFVAEPYTKRPGSYVSRADALRGCREILDGVHDDLPAAAFYFTGSIEEIRRAAGAA
jgi:RNA polymerase sigma factor (sigma-70 family)